MTDRHLLPYAPDQQFGVRVASDEAFLDRLLSWLDACRAAPPRPANKASCPDRTAQPSPMLGDGPPWLAAPLAAPCTIAAALEAAVWVTQADEAG